MSGIHTGAIAAEMVEGQTVGDRADEQFVRDTVCAPTCSPYEMELAVAVADRCAPRPALFRTPSVHLRPKKIGFLGFGFHAWPLASLGIGCVAVGIVSFVMAMRTM